MCNFHEFLPTSEEGSKPCIFLELCAGSARLSAAVRSTGIPVVPIDHKHNRHAPRCKIVQLDLSQPHAWSQLIFLLDNYDVLACHIAPPCGTCSRARGIPMPDGSPGPQPLRSENEPLGLRGLSYADQMRVDGANALYDVLGRFVEELHRRNIPWSVENPTNSLMWSLKFFLFAIIHGEWVDCHACAFGSTRKKLTTFLVSDAALYQPLKRFCPGNHEHEAWGFDHATSTFNTAKEAEYPDGMCRTYADIVQQIVTQRGLHVHDFNEKSTAVAPQLQKRGRRVPQVVPEFLWTKTVLVRHIPTVDNKKCLIQPHGDIPAGCKLLRTEANKGKDGDLMLCVFGCFRTMQQFVDISRQIWHSYDELKNLPDALVKTLFWYLTTGPSEITKHRINCLTRWRTTEAKLRSMEAELHGQMSESVARVLRGKNILLMRQVAEEMNWPDTNLFDEMTQGFELTGNFSACGIFKPQVNIPSLSVSQLQQNTKYLRPAILGRMKLTEGSELQTELMEVTEAEKAKGWLEGPFSVDEVAEKFGPNWLPVRRFGVKQKDKTRPIDDFRENTLNQTFGSVEKPELRTMDHVLWALAVLAQYLTFHEHMCFKLSDGSTLDGDVHEEWKKLKPTFKTTCVDLQSAYKQLAVHPDEHHRTVVTLWDTEKQKPACFISKVLPFGASASVHHFLRVSAFLHSAGLHMGLCWAAYFDDYALLTHECHEKSSLHAALEMLDIFGFLYSKDKLADFSDCTELLGVELNLRSVHSGHIKVQNKQSRIEETVKFLNDMINEQCITVDQMPSKLGKLQYAETQLWGRAGRLALADIRHAATSGKDRVALDNRTCKAVELLREKLLSGRPRTISVSKKKRPVVIFTDGSLEYDEGRHVTGIGGVCILPNGHVEIFGATVPSELLDIWTNDGEKDHVIGLIELYAVLTALHTWSRYITSERVVVFVDNWPAVDALVKGVSTQPEWRDLLMIFEILDEKQQSLHWFARVPSASNPADPPSRGVLSGLDFLRPFVICDSFCPVTNKCLMQTVKE